MPFAVSSAIYQNRKFQKGKMQLEKHRSGSGMASFPVPSPKEPVPNRQQTKHRVPSLYTSQLMGSPLNILKALLLTIKPIRKFLLHTRYN